MRLWSLHPQYLDTKGLVALWRETLLAKHVLEGKIKGYKNHPQLNRFKKSPSPADAIHSYLQFIYNEALKRGYHFDPAKFDDNKKHSPIPVTRGQLDYEWKHLLGKLKVRDKKLYNSLKGTDKIITHPLFKRVKGDVEDWEVIT